MIGASGATGDGIDLPDVVTRYFTAINAEDYDALGPVFASDAVLRAVGGIERHGRQEIVAHFPKVLAGLPEHDDEPTRAVVGTHDGHPVVTVEIRFVGRTPTGAPVGFDAVDVFDLAPDGSVITALSTWYDTAAVGRMVS
ncbi:nuclear transport factor 2 family protein [Actinomycetospora soli]|uniref:nuclear transport factor 2 family protein n=1 Tax=Actinomycetospora soli TaxID=2893887 RepID=UPI001E4A967F|nr:nuclear transport factor 2 family protein [Actinomycetospora soli]MCD2187273.1 nuclear transport factor 2 family protein [Actinomycetospora soli]